MTFISRSASDQLWTYQGLSKLLVLLIVISGNHSSSWLPEVSFPTQPVLLIAPFSEPTSVNCYAANPSQNTSYEIWIDGKLHSSTSNSAGKEARLPFVDARLQPLNKAGVYRAQCHVSHDSDTTIVSSSFFVQVVEVEWGSIGSSTSNGSFALLKCQHDTLSQEVARSHAISSDLWSRITWIDQSGALFSRDGSSDSSSHLVTYRSELLLLDVDVRGGPKSYTCLLAGKQIRRHDLYLGQIPEANNNEADSSNGAKQVFLLPPRDVEAIEHVTEYVEFECVGPSRCKPFWFFEGQPILSLEASYQLRLEWPDVSHQGVYSCGCQRDYQPESIKSANLTVHHSVLDSRVKEDLVTLKVFETKTLPCAMLANGGNRAAELKQKYSFGWYHNGKEVAYIDSDNSKMWEIQMDTSTFDLVLRSKDLSGKISGVFQCFARHRNSDHLPVAVSSPILVQVRYEEPFAQVTIPEIFQPIVERHLVEIRCIVSGGSSQKTVTWVRDDVDVHSTAEALTPSARFEIEKREQGSSEVLTLVIKYTELEDSGNYSCRVEDKAFRRKIVSLSTAHLKVLHRTALIQGVLDSWGVQKGKARLSCVFRIDSSVEPDLLGWQFWNLETENPFTAHRKATVDNPLNFTEGHDPDNNVIVSLQPTDDSNVKVQQGHLTGTKFINSTLELTYVMQEWAGMFKCEIGTVAGMEFSIAEFSVYAVPAAPGKPLAKLIESNRNVLLTMQPVYDGNLPISHVIVNYTKIEYQDRPVSQSEEGESWMTYVAEYKEVEDEDLLQIAIPVEPWSTYVFKVKMNNSIGSGYFGVESEPLRVPESVPSVAPGNVKATAVSSTAIDVLFDAIAPDDANGPMKGYNILYSFSRDLPPTKVKVSAYTTGTTISGLRAYEEVNVRVQGETSVGVGPLSENVQVRTMEDVPALTVFFKECLSHQLCPTTNTTVTVSWSCVEATYWNGPQVFYILYVSCDSCADERTIEVNPVYSSSHTISNTIGDLKPFTTYKISGALYNGKFYSNRSQELSIRTKESTPGQVSDIRLYDVTDQSVRLMWSEPEEPNGILTGYSIQLYELNDDSYDEHMALNDPNLVELVANFTSEREKRELFITNLKEQTQYVVAIQASTSLGVGDTRLFSFSSSIPPTRPSPPNNVFVSDVTDSTATIHFTHGFSGHTSINRWIAQVRNVIRPLWKDCLVFDVSYKPELTHLQLPEKFLSPNTKYRARLISCNIVGCSDPSEESFAFQTDSAVPSVSASHVVAQALSSTEVSLSWIPISPQEWNDQMSKCHYVVHYWTISETGAEDSNVITLDSQHNSTVIVGLRPYTMYSVNVTAKNSKGVAMGESISRVRTLEAVPCALSGRLTVGPGQLYVESNSKSISWQSVDNNCPNGELRYYQAELSYNQRVVQTVRVNLTTPSMHAQFSDLMPNLSYSARVAAVNGAGLGEWSARVPIRIEPRSPGRPQNLWMEINHRSEACYITISGTVAKEEHVDAIHLEYVYSHGPGKKSSSRSTSGILDAESRWFSQKLEACEQGSSINASVFFSNSRGYSEPRNFRTVVTRDPRTSQDMRPVENIEWRAEQRSVSFSWRHPDRLSVQNVSISVQMNSETGVRDLPQLAVTSFEDSAVVRGLSPNVLYQFLVTANGYFANAESHAVSAQTKPALPEAVPNVATFSVKNGQVTLRDVFVERKELNGNFDKFELRYRVFANASDVWRSVNFSVPPCTLEDLQIPNMYQINLAVHNEVGRGPWSNDFYEYVGQTVITAAPEHLKVDEKKTGSSFATVTWKMPRRNSNLVGTFNQHVLAYQVCYREVPEVDSGRCMMKAAGENCSCDITLEKLKGYSTYEIEVRAYNHAGLGPSSEPLIVSTDVGIPSPVDQLSVSVLSGSFVMVAWKKPANAQGEIKDYLITYSASESSNMVKRGRRSSESDLISFFSSGEVEQDLDTGGSLLTSSLIDLNSDSLSIVLHDLLPLKYYTFSVQGQTDAGLGDPAVKEAFTGHDFSLPAVPGKPRIERIVDGIISIQWDPPLYDDALEPITNYAVFFLYTNGSTIEAVILNKTFTKTTSMDLDLNATGIERVDRVLDNKHMHSVWFAVSAINRNGQSMLSPMEVFLSDDGKELPPMMLEDHWIVLSVICSLIFIILLLLMFIVILTIWQKKNQFKLRNKKGRNRKQTHKDNMMQRIHEAQEIEYLPPASDNHGSLSRSAVGSLSRPVTRGPRQLSPLTGNSHVGRLGGVSDANEERLDMDSDSANSSSHQPDVTEDFSPYGPSQLTRFASPITHEPISSGSPVASDMGTFGRSQMKRTQLQGPSSNVNPNSLAQSRVPLHANGYSSELNHAKYYPPASLQAVSKPLSYSATRESQEPDHAIPRSASTGMTLSSFRASLDDEEDSV